MIMVNDPHNDASYYEVSVALRSTEQGVICPGGQLGAEISELCSISPPKNDEKLRRYNTICLDTEKRSTLAGRPRSEYLR
jgi:hypothetical protein